MDTIGLLFAVAAAGAIPLLGFGGAFLRTFGLMRDTGAKGLKWLHRTFADLFAERTINWMRTQLFIHLGVLLVYLVLTAWQHNWHLSGSALWAPLLVTIATCLWLGLEFWRQQDGRPQFLPREANGLFPRYPAKFSGPDGRQIAHPLAGQRRYDPNYRPKAFHFLRAFFTIVVSNLMVASAYFYAGNVLESRPVCLLGSLGFLVLAAVQMTVVLLFLGWLVKNADALLDFIAITGLAQVIAVLREWTAANAPAQLQGIKKVIPGEAIDAFLGMIVTAIWLQPCVWTLGGLIAPSPLTFLIITTGTIASAITTVVMVRTGQGNILEARLKRLVWILATIGVPLAVISVVWAVIPSTAGPEGLHGLAYLKALISENVSRVTAWVAGESGTELTLKWWQYLIRGFFFAVVGTLVAYFWYRRGILREIRSAKAEGHSSSWVTWAHYNVYGFLFLLSGIPALYNLYLAGETMFRKPGEVMVLTSPFEPPAAAKARIAKSTPTPKKAPPAPTSEAIKQQVAELVAKGLEEEQKKLEAATPKPEVTETPAAPAATSASTYGRIPDSVARACVLRGLTAECLPRS